MRYSIIYDLIFSWVRPRYGVRVGSVWRGIYAKDGRTNCGL